MKKDKNRSERLSELQKESLERPGIKDVMIILNHWQKAYEVEQAHQKIKEVQYKMSHSDKSSFESFRTEMFKKERRMSHVC